MSKQIMKLEDDIAGGISNKTEYKLNNDGLRYVWIGYHIIILLNSLAFDTAILVASIKYKAFKLHALIVVIIEHVAVCGLFICTTTVLPKIITLITEEWVLGDFLCHITAFSMYYFNGMSMLLVCAMSTSKLLIIRYPLKLRTLTRNTAHKIISALWIAFMLAQAPMVILSEWKNEIIFDNRLYNCKYSWRSGFWQWLRPVLTAILTGPPNIIVAVSIFPLLVYLLRARKAAKKSGGVRNWRGIMTAFLTAAIYLISYVPYIVFVFMENSKAEFVHDPEGFFQTHFNRLVASFIFLNTFSNFYICVFTSPSFRRFLVEQLCRKSRGTAVVGEGNGLNKVYHNRNAA